MITVPVLSLIGHPARKRFLFLYARVKRKESLMINRANSWLSLVVAYCCAKVFFFSPKVYQTTKERQIIFKVITLYCTDLEVRKSLLAESII